MDLKQKKSAPVWNFEDDSAWSLKRRAQFEMSTFGCSPHQAVKFMA